MIASLVIAYLLEGPVGIMQRRQLPRLPAVLLVFTLSRIKKATLNKEPE